MGPSMHAMSRARALASVALAGALGLVGAPGSGSPEAAPAREGPAPARTGGAPPPPILGFAINAHHIGTLPAYLESVDEIAATGANALVLVTPFFQERVDSSEIRFDESRCPTREQLLEILERARDRRLHTTLLPIVLIEQPGEKDWRGVIRPRDWAAWWRSYDGFIEYFLEIAVAGRVDVLSVGSELNSTEHDAERWRRIIDRVRERFGGEVTYTANWDRYRAVTFWGLLDFIGVSSYFELSPQEPDASLSRLTRAWRAERDRLLRFARGHDRPVVLMELGYPSLPSAAAHPWDYVNEDGRTADHETQANCYRAFFDAWSGTLARRGSHARGFYCYYWDPYHRGEPADTGYGVRGKPALEVIREGFTRIRGRRAER